MFVGQKNQVSELSEQSRTSSCSGGWPLVSLFEGPYLTQGSHLWWSNWQWDSFVVYGYSSLCINYHHTTVLCKFICHPLLEQYMYSWLQETGY
jgi:hypothetical protein